MQPTKNIFLANDIIIQDYDSKNFERYEFTRNKEAFVEFIQSAKGIKIKEPVSHTELTEEFPKEWERFQDTASFEEIYEIPMMNALRYFPSFIDLKEEDRYKTTGTCTLLYDNDEENGGWAIGMTGGGMDLGPDLLATFINLESGVPLELAFNISRDYSAYISKEIHEANCDLLAQAFLNYGNSMFNYAIRLNPTLATETLKRHLKGLQKLIK